MNLSKKKEYVENFKERLLKTKISILVNYKGLDVKAMTSLRSELRKEGVQIGVIKNTLLRIASKSTESALMKDSFSGQNAIITCKDDPVAPAKVLVNFAKDNNNLKIKIGVMNKKILGLEDIMVLAKMPPREVLLAQVLATINSVPTSMVRVLGEVPRSFCNVLNAIGDQKKAA